MTGYRKTILVTGASGQLGKELQQLAENFPHYQFLFTTKDVLPIENAEAVRDYFEKQQIHYCVNCAAYTAVDKAEQERDLAFLVNAEGAGNLAAICSDHQTKLIHISTDYVYDGSHNVALKEEDAVAPLNVYGWSKLRGEELILNKCPSALIIRTSWVFSAFGNNFVKTIIRLCKEREKLSVINDQSGSPTYAADLAAVIMTFIERSEFAEQHHGIVNYCNEGAITWYEFALAIIDITRSKCAVHPIASSQYKTAAVRPAYSILDTSKIKNELKIAIPFWKDSLEKCIARIQQM